VKQQKPIKRKSERDMSFEISDDEDEDEDTEEAFRQIRECGPKKFYRNTDDDSEEEESEPSIILITPPPTVEEEESEASVILITPPPAVEDIIDVTVTPSKPHPRPPIHSRLHPLYTLLPMKHTLDITGSFTMITINYVYIYLFLFL
jgi:hypothetical protein